MAEITYLMERDPSGSGYFSEAQAFFSERPDSTVVPTTGDEPTTLDDVLKDLRVRAKDGDIYSVINLVSHASGFSALQFPISVARRGDDGGIITTDTLKRALTKGGADGYPAILGAPAVSNDTTVCLYGCDVGRDAAFMTLLGQMFGPELTIYAPLRMAVFRHQGTAREHRLARTWSVPWTGDVRKSTDWGPVRTQFVTKAGAKFSAAGGAAVETAITAAAQSATATLGNSFFFADSLRTNDNPATHTVTGTSSVLPGGTVDDTTVPLSVTNTDFVADPSRPGTWVAWAAVLGQVIEEPVSIENASQYRKTVISAPRAATTGFVVPEDETEPTHPVEEPMSELFGKYRATVVDDADPTSTGRLLVNVPAASLTDVWAVASLPPIPTSLLQMPPAGADVWVEFEGGDATKPIWTGATWHTRPTGDVTLESDGTVTIQAAQDVLMTSGMNYNVTAGAQAALRAGLGLDLECTTELALTAAVKAVLEASQVDLNTAMTVASGTVNCQTLTTQSVVSPSYTPGAGNQW